MRNINCRNVRREIEETAPGGLLSSPANDHVTNCVPCETLSREHVKLQEIVSSLGTVEAPGDFDFRLRARLVGEKPGSARSFALFGIGGVSFGLRSVAVAAMLLLVAAAFVLVSLRAQSDNSFSAKAPTTEQPQSAPQAGAASNASELAQGHAPDVNSNPKGTEPSAAVDGSPANAFDRSPAKPRSAPRQTLLATFHPNGRVGVRDISSTQAQVITRDNELAGTYPTTAFPINASYQSLKVSVDNGRGSLRTISLPTVSFGSKQSLSQSSPPLMAAAREAW